jgi:alpha-glucosidase
MAADEGGVARMRREFACFVVLLSTLGGFRPARAQTLARKGWAGSGLTIDPWWKGAVLYEIDPLTFQDSNGDGFGDLNGITHRMDYLRSLGVDAIVLSPFHLQPPSGGTGSPFEPVYGTEEDFDHLEQEASLRRMRVIVDLPLSAKHTSDDTLAMARFWLSRGVGGLRLVAEPAEKGSNGSAALSQTDEEQRVRLLRRLCAGYVGDRVLLWDVAGAASPGQTAHAVTGRRGDPLPTAPQLSVDHAASSLTSWNATSLRALVTGAISPNAVLVSDEASEARSWSRLSGGMDDAERLAVAKMVATAMLAGREAPMIFNGQEIGMASNAAAPTPMQWGGEPGFTSGAPWIAMGPNAGTATVAAEDGDKGSLLNWYRKLSALRQEGFALKSGTVTLVDTGYPEVVAWVRRGSIAGERPVLVMCNLSAHEVLISVEQQLKQIGLKPSNGMIPLALSFTGINPSYTATGIVLPPYGIYLGEILQPGLEDSPAPYVSHKRGR